MQRNGYTVSLTTIYRISADLHYRWTKPWHTDVFTSAQKLKCKIFCAKLLRLSESALLNAIDNWMFTDEKWWDLVGPAAYKYVKASSDSEAKQQNQVCFHFVLHFLHFCIFCIHEIILFSVVFVCYAGVTQKKQKGGGE